MARRVVFDAGLYLHEAVEAAAVAYREHVTVDVDRRGDGIVATLAGPKLDDEVVDGFCNHALFETVARRRQAALAGDA